MRKYAGLVCFLNIFKTTNKDTRRASFDAVQMSLLFNFENNQNINQVLLMLTSRKNLLSVVNYLHFNPLLANAAILYLLKTPENLWGFFSSFQRV